MRKKERKRFLPETVQLLFNVVDEDDVVDENVSLPAVIPLQCTMDNIRDNYSLCLQYWEEGVERTALLNLVLKVLNGGELSAAERMQYKYMRSRYKHLRFSQRLYSKSHTSRFLFSKTTVFLGRFQDAFRNENKQSVKHYGRLLRFYLSAPVWAWVSNSLRRIQLDAVDDFMAYRQAQMRLLQGLLIKPQLTGEEFHSARKIISQQVSYYDTIRAIRPDNQDARQISRFLAAINGLMGDRHDEMVRDNLAGLNSYQRPSQLDNNIRQRLELFLSRFPLQDLTRPDAGATIWQ
jgi:hypothetical protein